MSRKLIGQYRLRAYHAHMIAGTETRTLVDPATVDISDRIFTSEEEEHLPESMCDGHVMRRPYIPMARGFVYLAVALDWGC